MAEVMGYLYTAAGFAGYLVVGALLLSYCVSRPNGRKLKGNPWAIPLSLLFVVLWPLVVMLAVALFVVDQTDTGSSKSSSPSRKKPD